MLSKSLREESATSQTVLVLNRCQSRRRRPSPALRYPHVCSRMLTYALLTYASQKEDAEAQHGCLKGGCYSAYADVC